MEFKKIELNDRDLFLRYLGKYDFYTYEYSFVTLYLWRNYLNVEFAIQNEVLIIRKKCRCIGKYFVQPVGYKDEELEEIVNELNIIKREYNMEYLFRDVEEPFLNKLINIFGDKLKYQEDANNFDYIYNSIDLATLAGAKYRKRRNRYNAFINKYKDCYFKPIDDERTKNECKRLAEEWYKKYDNKTEEVNCELLGIFDLIDNLDLLELKTIAVYYRETLIGFAIGECPNSDMGIIHIEKCNREYTGIYAYISKVFIKEFFNDTKLINKEEDLGESGLRESKMEYKPANLGKKFIVNLEIDI